MQTPMHLTGRHVLVTGASAGIGRATAVLLSRLGARVTLTGRDETRLADTLAELAGDGHRMAAFDLADIDAIPAWIKELATSHGPFGGLAHCAGLQVSKPVRGVDLAFFDQILHVNLASALALARGLRQKGCHGDAGALVYVASVAAWVGQPGNAVYAASKGGLISAVRSLAMELLRDGLRVNAVAPGLVETEMTERFRATTTAEQFQAIVDRHPLGLGKPEDVANAVAFLLSDASRWITGVTLPVDGGHLVR
ncbi:SDR family NAD(P)-dependent oxidoreductase [Azospirillum sp.]|uniref:SDR family NAD(P)-dependent oxidoreductase n=1 Tax=Azospirillum sp. TaxID=34012 RepID=UPI002D71FF65|nr:SDR family NAD(P)-dependent oxidoreductase [Azospirillum sp.]HYD70514.1 SDR family NAD(P)-dependent oxidoreductase [Azospirillum sp.]